MINSDQNECNNIKSIAMKKNLEVDVTIRFIKGKMLMFSKLSLKNFAYDFLETFSFPTEEIRKIYNRNSIIKCHIYLDLTDTDSCSFFILFVCEIEC